MTSFHRLIKKKKGTPLIKPFGTSYDGTNDYLSRASDFTGNIDSKTFTFSCFVYVADGAYNQIYYARDTTNGFAVDINPTTGLVRLLGYAVGGTGLVLQAEINIGKVIDTYISIIGSVDLANMSNRSVYINDKVFSVTWVTYTNALIEFSTTDHYIGANPFGSSRIKGRLSNLFLDYTYRDLSIEANRRLFIDADGKPVTGLGSLNPILYLPMKDASTAHINEGTGGNFTPNGTLATADRGANQNNCVASEFNGVDDYLSSTGIGAVEGNKLLCCFNTKAILAGAYYICNIRTAAWALNGYLSVYINNNNLTISARDTTDATILNITVPVIVPLGKNISVQISLDLSNTANRYIYINGVAQTPTYTTYINGNIPFDKNEVHIGTNSGATGFVNVDIGEFYLDTNYIDLATNNPFWDSTTNKPKPVRQVLEETGANPLIAMPISADNPELNLGSGGDFTLNGGGLVGARGASEFIARSAESDGSTGHLSNASNLGASDSKAFTAVFSYWVKTIAGGNSVLFATAGSDDFKIVFDNGQVQLIGRNTVGSAILFATTTTAITGEVFGTIMLSIDLSNTSNRHIYNNGVAMPVTWSSYTNDFIKFASMTNYWSFATNGGSTDYLGKQSNIYFTTDYIDFSDESIRNIFVNQLGYPRDLTPEIEAGNIPTPLIYLPFDDTDNLGKNDGTGGDFTVNGTVTAGADFNI